MENRIPIQTLHLLEEKKLPVTKSMGGGTGLLT